MKPTIATTSSTSSIQKKISQPYESVEDWFQSQKDIPDSEDQENLYSYIGSYKRSDTIYEKIEFNELAMAHQKLSNIQSLQTNPQAEYITILADTEENDYTLGMTRRHSDTQLHCAGENNYTLLSDIFIESDSLQSKVNKHSYYNSLPHIPGFQDGALPPVDVSPSQEPSSSNIFFVPMHEELHTEERQTDATSADNINIHDTDHKDYQFVVYPVVSLGTTNDAPLQCKPCLSHSCSNIPSTISDRPKQIQVTTSLDIPSCNDSQLRVRSHSMDTLAVLNQEVCSNSLHPERKENNQPYLIKTPKLQ